MKLSNNLVALTACIDTTPIIEPSRTSAIDFHSIPDLHMRTENPLGKCQVLCDNGSCNTHLSSSLLLAIIVSHHLVRCEKTLLLTW